MPKLLFAILFFTAHFTFAQESQVPSCAYKVEQTYDFLVKNFPGALSSSITSAEDLSKIERFEVGNLINDEALSSLCSLTQLKVLRVWNDNVTDGKITAKSLWAVSYLTNLTELDLDGNSITPKDLEVLKPLKNLVTIQYGQNNPLGSESLAVFEELPELVELNLAKTGAVPANLTWMSQTQKVWSYFYLNENPALDNSVLSSFKDVKVKQVYLANTGISTSSGFEYLASNPVLDYVDLQNVPWVSDEEQALAMEKLKSSSTLEGLAINAPANIAFFESVAAFKNLKFMTVELDGDLTDPVYVEGLLKLSHLRLKTPFNSKHGLGVMEPICKAIAALNGKSGIVYDMGAGNEMPCPYMP